MSLGRMALKMAKDIDDKKPRKKKDTNQSLKTTARAGKEKSSQPVNRQEHAIITAIDNFGAIKKYEKLLVKLATTKDVNGFLQDIAPNIAAEMLMLATGDAPEKIKLEAFKDILDRAGYGKVTKHAVARFDASSSKDAIISSILGAKKDLGKVGIEIVDDDDEETDG